MIKLFRRFLPSLFCLVFLACGMRLMAYPVSVTIQVNLVNNGGSDPLGLAGNSATITATLPSATTPPGATTASYPGTTILVSIPAIFLTNAPFTGTLTINTNGSISGSNFHDASGNNQFNPNIILNGVSFPVPGPTSFGSASLGSASSASYTVLGASGTLGLTGTVTAYGLTASPISPIVSTYQIGGSAPAPQAISVGSNNPGSPSVSYTAALSPPNSTFLTLSSAGGTTPGSLTANFSTSVDPGTYSATIQINTAGSSAGPITIPVTYTVTQGNNNGPGLRLSPSSLSFQFILPSSTSQSQTVSVTSTSDVLDYSATVASGAFLTISPTGGTTPGSIRITASPAGLSAGTYTGSIQFTSSGAPTINLPVTMVITNPGVNTLSVLPAALTFDYVVGAIVPPPQTVAVRSTTPVSFNISNASFYLPVSPVAGTTNATVSVGLNPAGLSPGTYTDLLAISGAGGLSTTLPVTVHVLAGTISAAPTSLTFTYQGAGTPALSQNLALSTLGPIPFSATTDAPWLDVVQVAGRTNATVTVTAVATGLVPGSYSGSVLIYSSGGTAPVLTIPVSFIVAQAPPASVSVSPTAVSFAYQLFGSAPPSQTLNLAVSPAGTVLAATAVNAPWLTVELSGDGTSATLSVTPGSLEAGVYSGSVRISGQGLTNAPLLIPVTLTVSAGPALGVSPTSLTFTYLTTLSLPASQTLAVTSSSPFGFTATADAPWLSIASLSPSTPATIAVSVNPAGLANGTYEATISLVTAGTAPLTISIPVTLIVNSANAPLLSAVTDAISYVTRAGAPGLIVALFGQGLGPATPVGLQLTPAGTIATTAGGTQVLADGIPCPILFVSSQQVNAILPFALDGKTTTDIQVTFQGNTSNVKSLPVQPSAPGLFSADSSGQGAGAILNQDLTLNTAANPAPAGSVVVLYGGGGGQTNPVGTDGFIIPVTTPFPAPVLPGTVTIGGAPAQILYYGDAPGLVSGVLQINAIVPEGTASGPQPVVLTVGTASSQANLTVYVK